MAGGIFYTDNEYNEIFESKEFKEEIKENAKFFLESTKNIPNDVFPDYLWNVSMNEFEDDNYLIRGTCTDDAVRKVYTIGRKYSEYWDYVDAIAIYDEYMDYLEDMYGDISIILNGYLEGNTLIYIPKRPKLSNKKKNNIYKKSNFVPSRIDEDAVMDIEELQIVIDSISLKDLDLADYKMTKTDKRLLSQMIENRGISDRLSNIYATGGISRRGGRTDAIIKYLTGEIDYKDDINSPDRDSFTSKIVDFIENGYESEDDEILERYAPKSPIVENGMLVKPSEKVQIEVLEDLEKNGYDFLSFANGMGMDKRAVRMITKKYSVDPSTLSPKELRKLKKREAKERKAAQNASIGNRRLQSLLLNNKVDISGLGDFTVGSILGTDD